MELGSIVQFLENRSILVTGATGFLAKIFVEKILRTQPNVKKLYLLLRAADLKSATKRLQDEIVGKDLFKVLKEKMGGNFDAHISNTIALVPGDISCEDLGVTDSNTMVEMLKEVDVIINSAATTNFDERYDVALGLNTRGTKNILCFAKKCTKLKVLVHVSTGYVWGEEEGLMMEKPFQLGEALNGCPGLDVDVEENVVKQRLNELRREGASESTITWAMKELGMERARKYGWPNSYVFTKAMGEMLVGNLRENIPVVILRPTIITSTYKEPFPGWLEGIGTVDSLAIAYGKGRLPIFLGDPESIVDAIPADMVVNAIIVAMVANANQPLQTIYQIGSSVRNPLIAQCMHDCGYLYFAKKPWIKKDGTPVAARRVNVLTSMESFNRYMYIRYLLPLKGLEVANSLLCQYFEPTYTDLSRKISFVMRLVELYRPYLFFKACFDDINTEKLRLRARESCVEADAFQFDPKCIVHRLGRLHREHSPTRCRQICFQKGLMTYITTNALYMIKAPPRSALHCFFFFSFFPFALSSFGFLSSCFPLSSSSSKGSIVPDKN